MPGVAVHPSAARLGTFTVVSERRYVMEVVALGITFDLTRIRRDRHEFVGELLVRCTLAGARTIDGVLNVADFNLSSLSARVSRAKVLGERAQTKSGDVDWMGLLEEFCQRVLTFDRDGTAERPFREIPAVGTADAFEVIGLPLLTRHPVIWFGDGGSAKSLLALFAASRLAAEGQRVLYADWEFSGEDHRMRLERLCAPDPMPATLWYAWCAKPLIEEVDRLAGMIAAHQVSYLVCDSIGFACKGAPESAEAANEYFRAVRALKVGSLHLAHITKGGEESGAEQRPFGSIFWHNGARATWFLKRADDTLDGNTLDLALIQRKANVGQRQMTPRGLRFRFLEAWISVDRFDVTTHQELGAKLPLWQRMRAVLGAGALDVKVLAERLDAKPDSVRRAVNRMDLFVRLSDDTVGLRAH